MSQTFSKTMPAIHTNMLWGHQRFRHNIFIYSLTLDIFSLICFAWPQLHMRWIKQNKPKQKKNQINYYSCYVHRHTAGFVSYKSLWLRLWEKYRKWKREYGVDGQYKRKHLTIFTLFLFANVCSNDSALTHLSISSYLLYLLYVLACRFFFVCRQLKDVVATIRWRWKTADVSIENSRGCEYVFALQ